MQRANSSAGGVTVAALLMVTGLAMASAGCDGCGGSDGESSPEAPEAAESTLAEQAAAGSDTEQTHRLWVGLRCSKVNTETEPDSDAAHRAADDTHFSLYLDGRELQRLDAACNPDSFGNDMPPNGGQFAVRASPGAHVLRFQDDTSDHHAEETIHVRGDTWVTISHRDLGTGYMTAFDAAVEAPPFDMTDTQ